MQAVRLHGIGDLRVEEIAMPEPPSAGEVTLAVAAAGICGSDLHNYRTGAWITRAPSVVGHEFTGTVTALGAGVAQVAIGDRVIVDSRHTCGNCPACREGLGQVCENLGFLGEAIDGGFAAAVTLPARNVLRAPERVADRHLAMAEPLAVALHALRRLGAPPGARLVIAGCGPIGGLVALLANRDGHPVDVIDRNARRAGRVAREVGGRALTLDDIGRERFRFAVDTTGSTQVIRALAELISGCATIALIGIGGAAGDIEPVTLVEKEISLIGCHAFGDELAEVGQMLPELSQALDPFIAEQIALDAVPDAYDRHLAGKVDGLKTIILCGGVP